MTSRYEEHRPRRAPRRYVACVWTQVNTGPAEHRQLVVPDGCVDLVWRDGVVQVIGPDRGAWVAPLAPGAAIAGVRLRPGAAPLVLGRVPAEEVRDLRVPLGAVSVLGEGRAPGQVPLAERLAGAGPERAAAVLEEFVAGLAADYRPDTVVEQAIGLLRRGGSQLPDLGLSERQLRRRFTDAVGYGPKTLHSILRFQHAIRLSGSLAGIAYEAGYADQAHFTREVRRLAGTTPRKLLSS